MCVRDAVEFFFLHKWRASNQTVLVHKKINIHTKEKETGDISLSNIR